MVREYPGANLEKQPRAKGQPSDNMDGLNQLTAAMNSFVRFFESLNCLFWQISWLKNNIARADTQTLVMVAAIVMVCMLYVAGINGKTLMMLFVFAVLCLGFYKRAQLKLALSSFRRPMVWTTRGTTLGTSPLATVNMATRSAETSNKASTCGRAGASPAIVIAAGGGYAPVNTADTAGADARSPAPGVPVACQLVCMHVSIRARACACVRVRARAGV